MKLSIIVPVYNVEKYLAKCLDSLIHPELEDYEIIAVNDGSTDSSPAILEDYALRYPALIRVIHKENGGLGSARNAGNEVAAGEYILYVDSDDYLLPEAVAELMEICVKGYDICFFDAEAVDEDGKVLFYVNGHDKQGDFSFENEPGLLLGAPNAWNKLFRKSLMNGIEFPGRAWYEDIRTMPKLYLDSAKCCSIKKPYYRYLQRQGSIMSSKNIARNLEIIEAFDDLCSYYKKHNAYDKYANELEYLVFYHQYICAVVRVCLADKKSPLANRLRDDFIGKFPGYKNNPYVKNAPLKYKLLDRLIYMRMYGAVAAIMGINEKIK